MRSNTIVLVLATTTTGLVAGVFYGFSVAVNPGFARLPDPAYIAGMQAINQVIQNPVFAASFFGAPIFLPLAAVLHARRAWSRRFTLLVCASAIYLIGGLGVTVAANIPLNETLAQFPLRTASSEQAATARTRFAGPWNKWHDIRTLASTVSLVLSICACLSADPARPSQAEETNEVL
ncbi:anthrone oxygenase family protein [Hymenobacter terrenus]|uniref:anthrone oxygenase family protein n=1 Tax=Hymenobacter terrenus TaxID=1629124 RepID=UPI0006196734|nr:anthrone oxygenase family protein [Hymenobacter terrenus]